MVVRGGSVLATRSLFALCLSAAVVTTALMVPAPAFAGDGPTAADKDTARALMGAGNKAYAAGDFKAALQNFSGAHSIMNLPTTGLGVMRSQEKLGMLLEARDTAIAIGRIPAKPDEPGPEKDARDEAAKTAASLAERIPSITIVPTGLAPGATFTLLVDGEKVPEGTASLARKVNPGSHAIDVKADGYVDGHADKDVAEGQNESIPIEMKAIPGWKPPEPTKPSLPDKPVEKKPPEPGPWKLHALAIAGFTVTGVGVISGTVGGAIALSSNCKKDGIPKDCPQAPAWVANVGFGVAGVGAVLSIVGLALSGHSPPAQSATVELIPWVGPEGAGLAGRF
jgi:hypothetical protein